MLLRLLKNNRAPGIIFVLFLMIIVWMRSFISLPESGDIISMPLYQLMFSKLSGSKFISLIVSFLIYGILNMLVIRLNTIHFLLEERSFMPAAFFIMISATWPQAIQLNPILVSTVFLVMAILVLIRGDEHRAEPLSLFNATLILAVGSLFYLKIIWFLPFFWITASFIRPLKWRGIINPLMVLAMMGLFMITYYWVIRNDLTLLHSLLKENLAFSLWEFTGFNTEVYILLGYLLLLTMITSVHLISRFQFKKIIVRKLYQVLFIMFIYSLLFYFLISGYRGIVITIVAVPLAYLFSNFFQQKKTTWMHELMIWIWLLLILYVHFGDLILT